MGRVHPGRAPDLQDRHRALLDIGRRLTGTLSPCDLYRAIYEQTSRVLETAGFYVSLCDPDCDTATIVFYADQGDLVQPGVSYPAATSAAMRDGEAVCEVLEAPDAALAELGAGPCTRISAPLAREHRIFGAIHALGDRPDTFDDDDMALFVAIADLAAVAVENAHYVDEVKHKRREAERLEEIGRALTSSLDLTDVLDRIVEATRELMDADGVTVWLVQDDQAVVARSAGPLAQEAGLTVAVPEELYRHAVRHRRPLAFDHSRPNPLLPPELQAVVRSASALAALLIREDELIGALAVAHSETHRYGEPEMRLIERLANHATIAVANARLHDEIRTLSLTDSLTQLANRRHLSIFLDKEFAAAQRGRALTVILFDVDDFKLYNDQAGHQAGDEALRAFGEILASQTRAMNLAARYGGDEFLAVLSDTPHDGGRIHLERIMAAVDAHPVLGELGISAGIASYRPEMSSPQELIRAADRSLYENKTARNVGR